MATSDVLQGDRRATLDFTVGTVMSLLSISYAVGTFQAHFLDLGSLLILLALMQVAATFALVKKNPLHLALRALILVLADVALFLFCRWAGSGTGFYHFYLSLAALPLLFIPTKNRLTVSTCVTVAIVFYMSLEVFGKQWMLPMMGDAPRLVGILYWVLLPFRFVFLLVGAHYLALTTQKAQARINLTLSELRESVRTSRALLSAIPDMIFRVSDEGRFLDFHCHDPKNLLLTPEKLIGKRLTEVLPPAIAARLFDRVIAAIMCGDMHLFSFELEQNGVTHYYDTRIAGTGANDALMVVQDVSERVRAEKTILEQQIRAAGASKMASLGEMAAGIAHEINNPLAIISCHVQQLKDMVDAGDFEKENMAELADKVDQTALRISKIIRSLRFFARDGQDDPYEEASVREIVNDTLEFCRQRFLSHAVDLRVNPIPESLMIECRAVQIGQVLLNLLNNAHDAVEKLPDRWIELSVEDLEDAVRISVIDSGSGIASHIRGRILEPFFTTKEVGKGTGLGLSISKGIIESHHGNLYVDENWPHTRFVLEIPKKQSFSTQPHVSFPQSTEGR
jgi:C4-dicarboxylate-specific signal transduction histidine kinase